MIFTHMEFFQNPFYDYLFGSFGINIPSTRSGYKNTDSGAIQNPITTSVKEFRNSINLWLAESPEPNWPSTTRLLVAVQFGLTQKNYSEKDIDNITKSLVDALKGIVYEDDNQIDTLHVQKYISETDSFMVGIKELKEEDPGWYFPNFCSEKPWTEDSQTYTIKTKMPNYPEPTT